MTSRAKYGWCVARVPRCDCNVARTQEQQEYASNAEGEFSRADMDRLANVEALMTSRRRSFEKRGWLQPASSVHSHTAGMTEAKELHAAARADRELRLSAMLPRKAFGGQHVRSRAPTSADPPPMIPQPTASAAVVGTRHVTKQQSDCAHKCANAMQRLTWARVEAETQALEMAVRRRTVTRVARIPLDAFA